MLIEYNDSHHLGENIMFLRKKFALSRRALAKLLDISESQLKQIELGEPPYFVDSSFLCRLCNFFGISKDTDLFSSCFN